MPRHYIYCRDFSSDVNCTVALSADTKEELLEAAVQHERRASWAGEDTPESGKNS